MKIFRIVLSILTLFTIATSAAIYPKLDGPTNISGAPDAIVSSNTNAWVTPTEYNRLKTGMTLDTVKKTVGKNVMLSGTLDLQGDGKYACIIRLNNGKEDTVMLYFDDGRLTDKELFSEALKR